MRVVSVLDYLLTSHPEDEMVGVYALLCRCIGHTLQLLL